MDLKIQAVLFNLDGVLADTRRYHLEAWTRLTGEEGLEFDTEIKNKIFGLSRADSLVTILKCNGITRSEDEIRDLTERKNTYYLEGVKKINRRDLLSGSVKLVKQIREKGLQTALCSSSKNAQFVADSLGIAELFHTIVSGWDITKPKPDPQLFVIAAERLGFSPRVCAVLEDGPLGIEAAKAAGMKAIGIGDPLILGLADLVVPSCDALSVEYHILGNGEP